MNLFMMENFSAKEAESDERVLKIAAATDEFEGYRTAHASRLAALADTLAQTFNLASHDRYSLRQAALLHDVGEAVMNREYIRNNRPLREDERVDIQRHTIIGEQETAKRGLNRAVQLLVRWHHEWWNGAGYPDALEGEQIPFAARILRVCDTFCALTDARPYRAAMSGAEARRYLTEWAGIEFDPVIVKALLVSEQADKSKTDSEASAGAIEKFAAAPSASSIFTDF
jgi:putative nucleotidyltransferase with HDIG domain